MTTTTDPNAQMLARRALRLAALAALRTIPGVDIQSPGDWASQPATLPAVLLRCGPEQKQAPGRSMPQFTTSLTLELSGRIAARTADSAQDAIEALGQAIETALLGNAEFVRLTQGITAVVSRTTVDGDSARHIGALHMVLTCEVFEHFDPVALHPEAYSAWESMRLHADLTNVADPSGTYSSPPFPTAVTPAPRTQGPDGRDEGGLMIDIPNA